MYKIGDIVKCKITGFKDYGIFVNVDEFYNGLIHISEITDNFVENVHDYCELGEIIYAKIIAIDSNNNHLSLSIKNINYRENGEDMQLSNKNGFKPLKMQLNLWVNEKLKEMYSNDKKDEK